MKVLLVYPSLNVLLYGYSVGLGYIAALLKQHGHDVKSFAVIKKEDISLLLKETKAFSPDIIGFSAVSSQFKWVNILSMLIREQLKSQAFLVCGGVHPTLDPECLSQAQYLDAIVRGEGEYAMVNLVNRLGKEEVFFKTKNVYFRKGNKIIKNELRPLIESIDKLPFPDMTVLNMRNMEAHYFNLVFSRGCPFNCSYCCNHAIRKLYKQKKVRTRSPQKAVQEIKRLVKNKKSNSALGFNDDTFSIDRKWLFEFLGLYSKSIKCKFWCNIKVGTADEEVFVRLSKGGCEGVRIGVETGDEELRKKILKKNISNAQIVDTFRIAKKSGLKVASSNLIGLPYETAQSFEKTIEINRKIKADGAILYVFQPYIGTDLYDLCLKEGFINKETLFGDLSFVERKESCLTLPEFSNEKIRYFTQNFHDLIGLQ